MEDLGPPTSSSSMAKGICVFVDNQVKESWPNLLHWMNMCLNKINTKQKRNEKINFVSLETAKVVGPTSLFQASMCVHGNMYTLTCGKECIMHEENMLTCTNIVAHI